MRLAALHPQLRSSRRTVARALLLGAAASAAVVVPSAPARAVPAPDGLAVTTPYPSVVTEPGSVVKVKLGVAGDVGEPVALDVSGLPDGWTSTLRGGGFVIKSITTTPGAAADAELEIDVAQDAPAGDYPIVVAASDGAGTATATVTLSIAEQVNSGIGLTADFPSLSGEPGTAFTYNLTITNNTPESQTFTFDPTAPQGWDVTASPTAEAKAQTVTIDAGASGGVKVTATPPATADQGSYDVDVTVTAANGASGHVTLTAEVTGTPKLTASTADQRLDVSGRTNTEKRVPIIVANSGTAPLENVKLAGTAPTGWEVSFDPQQIASVQPNETAQAVAIIKPGKDAVAGDYAVTVRTSAGSESSNLDLRFALEGSRTLGLLAIGVIVIAFGALAGLFVKFGRR